MKYICVIIPPAGCFNFIFTENVVSLQKKKMKCL